MCREGVFLVKSRNGRQDTHAHTCVYVWRVTWKAHAHRGWRRNTRASFRASSASGTTFSPLTGSRRGTEERRMSEFSGLKDGHKEQARFAHSTNKLCELVSGIFWCAWMRYARNPSISPLTCASFFQDIFLYLTYLNQAKCTEVCNHYCDISMKLK